MEHIECYYENAETISCPGMPTTYKGTRATIAQWKELYPHITAELFGSERGYGPFRKVAHKDLEPELIAALAMNIVEQFKVPYQEALSQLRSSEQAATDTTVRYAMRVAHDTLKSMVDSLGERPTMGMLEILARRAWEQHTR